MAFELIDNYLYYTWTTKTYTFLIRLEVEAIKGNTRIIKYDHKHIIAIEFKMIYPVKPKKSACVSWND